MAYHPGGNAMFYERWVDCNHLDFGVTRVRVPANVFFAWWAITLHTVEPMGTISATANMNHQEVKLSIDPLLCIVEEYQYADADGNIHHFRLEGMEYLEIMEAA
jgi:hypothetical protein